MTRRAIDILSALGALLLVYEVTRGAGDRAFAFEAGRLCGLAEGLAIREGKSR